MKRGRHQLVAGFLPDVIMDIGERDKWRCSWCAKVVAGQRGWHWGPYKRYDGPATAANGELLCSSCYPKVAA